MQNLEEEDVDPETEINRRWERVASVYKESSKELAEMEKERMDES